MKKMQIVKIVMKAAVGAGLLSAVAFAKCDSNAQKLVNAYAQITKCEGNYIFFRNGTKMLYDDGRRKSLPQLLNTPDIQDMFLYTYPRGAGSFTPPRRNYDPGRIRYEPLFKKIYGSSEAAVRSRLRSINWFGRQIKVTSVNGVDRALQGVQRDLQKLPPQYRKFLYPIGGTFMWRKIAGTNRLSVHSFGAAIDINVKYSAYWRWSKGVKYQNKIPHKIVEIFERHGFIWGGKWYHYDTMHFEYRPELLR